MNPSRVPQAGIGVIHLGWSRMGNPNADEAVLLIYGFGANNHWRYNQPALAELLPTYAIDLLGFGRGSTPGSLEG